MMILAIFYKTKADSEDVDIYNLINTKEGYITPSFRLGYSTHPFKTTVGNT